MGPGRDYHQADHGQEERVKWESRRPVREAARIEDHGQTRVRRQARRKSSVDASIDIDPP